MKIIVIKGTEITNIADPFPEGNPPEGPHPSGAYILYLNDLDGLSPKNFINQRYWDGTSLQTRTPPPSIFCKWIGTSWTVDEVDYLKWLRNERDARLFRSDWTQLPDAPLTSEQLQESLTYRQALRDITIPVLANPQSYMSMSDIIWPTPPSYINAT